MTIELHPQASKMSKAEAYEMLLTLREGTHPSEIDLDSAILYFAPALPRPAKTAMEWVARACAKKDMRIQLNHITVSGGTAYGTDGHRIHIADTDFADGVYCPKTMALADLDIDTQHLRNVVRFQELHATHLTTTGTVVAMQSTPTLNDGKAVARVHFGDLNHPYNAAYVADAECGLDVLSEVSFMGLKHPSLVGAHKFGKYIIVARRA